MNKKYKNFLHLQSIANQLPDAFTNTKCGIKSHIPATNAPTRIDLPTKNPQNNNSTISKKRGRPLGAKDLKPRKSKKNENPTENKVDQIRNVENIINPHNIHKD